MVTTKTCQLKVIVILMLSNFNIAIANSNELESSYLRNFTATNCGVSSIYVACRHFGLSIDYSDLVSTMDDDLVAEGASFKYMGDQLQNFGLYTKAVYVKDKSTTNLDSWLENGDAIILHSPFHHFVCLGKAGRTYLVVDSGYPKKVGPELLLNRWDGYSMRVSSSPLPPTNINKFTLNKTTKAIILAIVILLGCAFCVYRKRAIKH